MKVRYLAAVISLSVASQGFAQEHLNIQTSTNSAKAGDNIFAVSQRDENTDYSQQIWVNDFGDVVGHGLSLHVTSEMAAKASEVKVCEKQTLNTGLSISGCSEPVLIGAKDYRYNISARDLKPIVTNVKFSGFPAIGEEIHVSYDFEDPDEGDTEVGSARVFWEYAKASDPSNFSPIPNEFSQDLIIPTSAGSESLQAGDVIRAVLSVTSSGVGQPTSDIVYTQAIKLFENYPGGNVTEDKYYRPLYVTETAYAEGPDNTYLVDDNGEATSNGDANQFAILPHQVAVEECTNLGLSLVSNANELVDAMNNSTDTAKWPQHKPYWTAEIDGQDPWLDPYTVAYDDAESTFTLSASNPIALGLVVCEIKQDD